MQTCLIFSINNHRFFGSLIYGDRYFVYEETCPCPILASPRTSLDKLVELIGYLTFVPRTGTPGHHCPKCRAAGVEFVGVDPDYKRRRRVARSRRSSKWLRTTVVAVVYPPYGLDSAR